MNEINVARDINERNEIDVDEIDQTYLYALCKILDITDKKRGLICYYWENL